MIRDIAKQNCLQSYSESVVANNAYGVNIIKETLTFYIYDLATSMNCSDIMMLV